MTDDEPALLSFSIGPVQPFIAGAKTVRDLWTGSYLLAWLTFKAMGPVLHAEKEGTARVLSPSLDGDPFRRPRESEAAPDGITVPCLPNQFLAELRMSQDDARDLAERSREASLCEWQTVADGVWDALKPHVDKLPGGEEWDRGVWDAQVESFFEMCAVVLPAGEPHADRLDDLFEKKPEKRWGQRLATLAGLRDAIRSVRHCPDYTAEGLVPQKCTLMGTFEQMGPAKLDPSREFWQALARRKVASERIREGERLCAISLIKRFAWPAYLSHCDVLNLDIRDNQFNDTATVAAGDWLNVKNAPDRPKGRMNGQWVYWPTQDHGARGKKVKPPQDDAHCPDKFWDYIKTLRSLNGSPPPAYYAVLMLDGDNLGHHLKDADGPEAGLALSGALTRFAQEDARRRVDQFSGELIYAGGDDLLAMMPTARSLCCARDLQQRYVNRRPNGFDADKWTISGGLVVAHYKEDLRFVLNEARAAEKRAKNAGRDRLAVTVLRRSGEHTSAAVKWDQVETLGGLTEAFREEVSDRWAYTLRAELPTLGAAGLAPFKAEMRRLILRADFPPGRDPKVFADGVETFLDEHLATAKDRPEAVERAVLLEEFVTLIQTASFLARGRDA